MTESPYDGRHAYFTETGIPFIRDGTAQGMIDAMKVPDAIPHHEQAERISDDNPLFVYLVQALHTAQAETPLSPSERHALTTGALLAYHVIETALADNSLGLEGAHYDVPLQTLGEVIDALNHRLPGEAWRYTFPLVALKERLRRVDYLESLIANAGRLFGKSAPSQAPSLALDALPREVYGSGKRLESLLGRVHAAGMVLLDPSRHTQFAALIAPLYEEVQCVLEECGGLVKRMESGDSTDKEELEAVIDLLSEGKEGVDLFLDYTPSYPPGYNWNGDPE